MREWRYSSTSALDLGEWWGSRSGRFSREEGALVRIGWVSGYSPEPVWNQWRREKSCNAGNRTRAIQPVARRYTESFKWSLSHSFSYENFVCFPPAFPMHNIRICSTYFTLLDLITLIIFGGLHIVKFLAMLNFPATSSECWLEIRKKKIIICRPKILHAENVREH
jgi:hypothetical protein